MFIYFTINALSIIFNLFYSSINLLLSYYNNLSSLNLKVYNNPLHICPNITGSLLSYKYSNIICSTFLKN